MVARSAKSAQPGGPAVPSSRVSVASQPDTAGRLPAAHEVDELDIATVRAKLGPLGATMATARKIATIFYTMVKNQIEYDQSIWADQEAKRQRQFGAKLRCQTARFGYTLVPQNAHA